MTIASGSNVELSYVAEVTAGTTPATPAFQKLPISTESLTMTRDTLESEALRADRQIADVINGNKQVSGDVTGEVRYGAFDDLLEAALGGSWATDTPVVGTDQLKAGTTRRSFTFERLHADLTTYFRSRGVEMGGFTLDRAANAITTLAFNAVGLSQDSDTAAIAGSTYTSAVTTAPMDGFTGTFTINSSSDACVTTASVTLENGNEALFCIGSDSAVDQAQGKSRITGSLGIYFEDLAAYNLFNSGTYFDLEIVMTDGAGNQYKVILPKIKYTSADTSVGGSDPLTYSYDISAVYDPTEQSNIVIERTPI